MKIVQIFFCFISLILVFTHGLKVLGVLPIVCKSHFMIGQSILKTQHGNGHNISVITPFPSMIGTENYHEISIENVFKGQPSSKVSKHYDDQNFHNAII
jgi:hypothetical protein